jgi:diguanylate cyclase (GGDEF)-like protein
MMSRLSPLSRGPSASGFSIRRRLAPFVVIAVLAELSAFLPPGPSSYGYFGASLGLLAAAGIGLLVPWRRMAPQLWVLVPVVYVASVLFLVLAVGGSSSGVGVVVLVPLIWTVLYLRRSDAAIVIAAILVVQVVTSFTPTRVPDAVIARKVVFWALLGTVIAISAHQLRDRLRTRLASEEELRAEATARLRHSRALEGAAEQLATTLERDQILNIAVKLSAESVAPVGDLDRRANYMRLADGTVQIVAQHDASRRALQPSFSLAEHPALAEAFATGRPFGARVDTLDLGPVVARMVQELGIVFCTYVPVVVEGRVDGVLTTSVRQSEISEEYFEHAKALGHLVELALSNSRAHEVLRTEAVTDQLTGLANRRWFDSQAAMHESTGEFCVLVVDVDNLKHVNDSLGHDAGDEVLRLVAAAMQGAIRAGDALYRMGGDEFTIVAWRADASIGRQIAERVLAAVRQATLGEITPRVSVGVAAGGPRDDLPGVQRAADAAMYRVKRRGGDDYAQIDAVGPNRSVTEPGARPEALGSAGGSALTRM